MSVLSASKTDFKIQIIEDCSEMKSSLITRMGMNASFHVRTHLDLGGRKRFRLSLVFYFLSLLVCVRVCCQLDTISNDECDDVITYLVQSNVWKDVRKRPQPPCVVCKGSGRVDCHHCQGKGILLL